MSQETGRGAWTLTGGLLPAKPGSTSRTGYYRLAVTGERAIGSAYVSGIDRGHDAYVVNLAVVAIQRLVGLEGKDVDGWFGTDTDAAVRATQKKLSLEVDGIVGAATMRALLAPLVVDVASHNNVPASYLGGLLVVESALDPAAVGTNNLDHGLAQINLGAHAATVDIPRALDPVFAMMFTAADMSHIVEVWTGRTHGVDPGWIAIANHNSPKLAAAWAKSGVPPFVPGRLFQIEDYVNRVRTAW